MQRNSRPQFLWFAALVLCFMTVSSASAQIPAPAAPQRYALLVGINDYAPNADGTPSVSSLKGPGNDVALMKRLLIDRFGFRDDGVQIVTLVNERATHQAIRAAYSAMATRAAAQPNTVLLFYFSGHGSLADDTNIDEGDGVDETLVAYDSRLPGQSDIIDDELAAWQADLMRRAPTTRITYVFDSCHSGTGIKGMSDSSHRLSRYAPPAGPLHPRATAARDPDRINAMLPEGRDYVLLAGATADQLSYEDAIASDSGPVIHGFFTWYLAQSLRQNPRTSYDALLKRISGPMQVASGNQTPQGEGAIGTYVLSGTGEAEDPAVPITRIVSTTRLELAGGTTLGLRQGSLLAIYRPGTMRLQGDNGKIADARISTLGNASSVAEIIGTPSEPVTLDARVALVTPYFGTAALRANVAELPGQKVAAADRAMLADVAAQLRARRFVAAAKPGEDWDVAVNRGCVKGGRIYTIGEQQPAGCAPAYYLRPRASSVAMIGFSTPIAEGASARIAESIELVAAQKNLRAIENQSSMIEGQIELVLIKVKIVTDGSGVSRAEPLPTSPARGVTPIKLGESFLLRVENNSDYPLHVAVFNLASGGNSSLIGTATNGDLVAPHHRMIITPRPWTMDPPLGLESFKLIATTSANVNFRVLDSQRITARGPQISPLEWLLASAVDASVRDSGPGNVDLSEWTTTQLDLQIVP